jgi:hypothetical protein
MIEILEEELFLGKSGRLAWVGDSLVKHVTEGDLQLAIQDINS